MTIRARLTLWYAGMLFVSVLIIGWVVYHELILERAGGSDREAAESIAEERLEILGLWFGLPAAVVGLAGGWFLMRTALAPVATLTEAASRVTEHTLREPLPRTGNGDELDRLAEVFNATTARLDDSFQRIREFTLHASHELKTPLTVLHGELESAMQDPDLPPAQRERCETQLIEIQRLAKIVDGLTLLAKADAGQVSLARDVVPLDELVRDACEDAKILALPRRIHITLHHCEPLTILGDRNRLRQLLLNLTDNAIKYNLEGGHVTLGLTRENRMAELTVINSGPGVPSALQARVFEPFFRGDASHNDEVEGCGLGLSIAQWIVSTHGGTITLSSQVGGPTQCSVRFPLENT